MRSSNNVDKVVRTAQDLLDRGDPQMAMPYFWQAAKSYAEQEQWPLAAAHYEKAAYCYELEGIWDKAAKDYYSASEAYHKAGLLEKAKVAENLAVSMIKSRKA